jgi:AraC family transcriptional regulator
MDTEIPSAQCAAMTVRYYASAADVPSAMPGGSPGEIQIVVAGEAADAVVILLDRDFFSSKAREALGDDAAELAERCAAADPLMRGVGSALRSEFRAQSRPSAMFLDSLAGVVAIHLARNYCGGRKALRAGVGLAPGKLERVQMFIEQHLGERLRIERLAAAVHMSPFHFARLFKLATGQAPHAYLTARRVERAKELLWDGGLPLVHVAANVGFQTQGHFTEVFRRHAGVTPRHFRLMSGGRNGSL